MTYQIVVSRYSEDVEWTKQFDNIIIYNKGNALNGYSNIIPVKNVGREGHTYYTHIYENYEKLSDYTIFLQGNPFDHSPNIIKNINKFIESEYFLHCEFEFLSEKILDCNFEKCKHHRVTSQTRWSSDILPLEKVCKELFGEKRQYTFLFGAGAQFIVSKKRILKRHKDFYRKIIKLLDYSTDPIEGFVIERFHSLIFC